MEHPYNLSKEEIIRRIKLLGGEPDLENKNFDIYDQLLACEAVAEAQEDYDRQHPFNSYQTRQYEETNGSDGVSGNGNGGYKPKVDSLLFASKREVVEKLKEFTYQTPPIEVAKFLEELFIDYPSKEGHWLFVAQHWVPRAINRVIAQMIKSHKRGAITFRNPAGYFTRVLQFRAKRKFTGINGGCKQKK